MISLELSSIQHNRSKSAELAALMADYERRGGVVHELSVTRSVALPFNNETIAYGYKSSASENDRKVREVLIAERRTVEQLRAYVGLGLKRASAGMGISVKRLGHIAKEYGIVFVPIKPVSPLNQKRAAEALLVPDIKRRFTEGATQQDVMREFGFSADRLHRVANDHTIELPGAVNEEEDRKLIPRIEAFRDLGLPRSTCAKRIGMSQQKLLRIIKAYDVTYPKHVR
ncbi:hypothetical protein ACI2KS_10090 [Pseudomonas sp. NPDC087358]|uniref:hypothetical protein n=1 Tax=Pseudomonas sp. NPDC087358 TaxID=3364439 RepID=UPI00384F4A8F